jgi:SNF2 family DNA or RNA helicase
MKLSDLFSRFKQGDSSQPLVEWHLDPAEGVDFFLPDALIAAPSGSRDGLEVAVLQSAILRSAEEQGLVQKNHSGFTIFTNDFVRFEEDFYEFFDFPALFTGSVEVSFTGNTAQSVFSARPRIIMADGERIASFSLKGPFLSLGDAEQYRLNAPMFDALKALQNHSELAPGERSEYNNGRLVFDLKRAQSQGANLELAHFEQFEVIDPEAIGIHAQYEEDGGLTLTPTFEGIDVRETETRWGQLKAEEGSSLRVKNKLVLLKDEAADAVTEVLTGRRIDPDQVKAFLETPTAFINSAMIDLDTGFSLRVHGAEKFELRYFGDVEALSQDWFEGESKPEMPLERRLSLVKTEAEIDDLQSRVADAMKHGATVVEFEDHRISFDPLALPEQAVAAAKERIRRQIEEPVIDIEDIEPEEDLQRSTLAIDDNDEWLSYSGKFDTANLHSDSTNFSKSNLLRSPYIHQEEGIKWLVSHFRHNKIHQTGGALLADDMGLGKTYMTLVGIEEYMRQVESAGGTARPHLIVAPVSLLYNWRDEVAKTFKDSPFLDIVLLQSGEELAKYRVKNAGKETLQNVGVDGRIENIEAIRHSLKIGRSFGDERLDKPGRLVLTTYQTLRDYQFSMARVDWGIAAFDEAQNLKNPNALVTRAAKGLKSDFKLLATGTPVENSLKDFWCLLDTCTPGLLGSWQEFRQTYIQPILEGGNSAEVKQGIGASLRSRVGDFMLRRTKAQCLDGLPSKTIWVGAEPTGEEKFSEALAAKMPVPQKSTYDAVIAEVRAADPDERLMVALAALHSLRNICIHPDLHGKRAASKISVVEDSGKMAAVFKLLDNLRDKQEKCIVFLISKRAQQLLSAALEIRYGVQVDIVNGDTKTTSKNSDETRVGIIDRFQSAPGFGVIIMSPVAAGVGFTVTAANNVIHLERHWNPAKEAQATDRVYRIGQEKPVNVYLPIAIHQEMQSFDERLNLLLRNKTDLSTSVVTTDSVAEEEMMQIFG